jgi:hypothetical protein
MVNNEHAQTNLRNREAQFDKSFVKVSFAEVLASASLL